MVTLIEKVPKYETYILAEAVDGEHKGMHLLCPVKSSTFDRGGEKVPVLPMNGWRSRNLAEHLYAERSGALLKLGTAKLVRSSTLKDLPQWDTPNTQYLDQFTGIVAIEVVAVSHGYGCYITVEQMTNEDIDDSMGTTMGVWA